MALKKGGSLACVRPTRREECPGTAQGWEGMKQPAPQDTQTRSRLFIGQNGPSDSALAAASGWRLLAAQPLTGTRRAALLGTCARAAPLGAIRPRRGVRPARAVARGTSPVAAGTVSTHLRGR